MQQNKKNIAKARRSAHTPHLGMSNISNTPSMSNITGKSFPKGAITGQMPGQTKNARHRKTAKHKQKS